MVTINKIIISKSELLDLLRKGNTPKKDNNLILRCEFVNGDLIEIDTGDYIDIIEVE